MGAARSLPKIGWSLKLNYQVKLEQRASRIWASYISRWWFDFRLVPIFNTALAASKNDARFKKGQNQLKNKQLSLLI